jgi:hypothetical protein
VSLTVEPVVDAAVKAGAVSGTSASRPAGCGGAAAAGRAEARGSTSRAKLDRGRLRGRQGGASRLVPGALGPGGGLAPGVSQLRRSRETRAPRRDRARCARWHRPTPLRRWAVGTCPTGFAAAVAPSGARTLVPAAACSRGRAPARPRSLVRHAARRRRAQARLREHRAAPPRAVVPSRTMRGTSGAESPTSRPSRSLA